MKLQYAKTVGPMNLLTVQSLFLWLHPLIYLSVRICTANLSFGRELFTAKKLTIMKNLCSDVIIGLDILGGYSSVTMQFGGAKEPLVLCAAHVIDPPILFGDISPDCKPIAVKSRRYSEKDKQFIKQEVKKLHDKDAIEESRSPYIEHRFLLYKVMKSTDIVW